MADFVLKGTICYSKKLSEIKEIKNGYIVCVEGKSRGVFEKLPDEYKDLPVYDYGNKLIVPGLIDLHIHAPQFAYRGMGMDLELMDWLGEQAFPEEAKYSDLAYAKKAYAIFAAQMKKSATTRACIFATRHREATGLLMELMEETGLVTYVGKINMDREAPDNLKEESAERSAYDTFGWINENAGKYQRTKPILTPRFIPSCTEKLLEELREIRRTYKLPVQSHLSENLGEIEFVKELLPEAKFYGDGYDRYDLFGSIIEDGVEAGAIMAHSVYSGREETELIRKNGVWVAHCPASNMNLSSGIAPIRKYLTMGIRVGLGSDVAGGQSESIFRAITDAIQVSKLYWRLVDEKSTPITFAEAFYLATKGGGEFFGKVGSFEEGYELDAVVLDDSHLPCPHELTPKQRLERFAYLSADGKGIEAKFVAGEKIE